MVTVAMAVTVLAQSSTYHNIEYKMTFPALHPMFNYSEGWIPRLPATGFEKDTGTMVTNKTGAFIIFPWVGSGLQVSASGSSQAKWNSYNFRDYYYPTREQLSTASILRDMGGYDWSTILQVTSLDPEEEVELKSITLTFTVKTRA